QAIMTLERSLATAVMGPIPSGKGGCRPVSDGEPGPSMFEHRAKHCKPWETLPLDHHVVRGCCANGRTGALCPACIGFPKLFPSLLRHNPVWGGRPGGSLHPGSIRRSSLGKRLPVSTDFSSNNYKHYPQEFKSAHPKAFKKIMDDNIETK